MTPLTEHQLLIFWLQLALLVGAARGLGGLMRRMGQPAVVGELAAGLLLGPSVLGQLAPGAFAFLFPADPVSTGLLLGVAWLGVALLLIVTGFETDLELRHLGRSSALVATGSLVAPLVASLLFALTLPASFLGERADQVTFAPLGQRLVDAGLRRARQSPGGVRAGMTVTLGPWPAASRRS